MSNVGQLETWLWMLLALGLGAAVGLEREWRGHEAGIRTAALVCAVASLWSHGVFPRSAGTYRIGTSCAATPSASATIAAPATSDRVI